MSTSKILGRAMVSPGGAPVSVMQGLAVTALSTSKLNSGSKNLGNTIKVLKRNLSADNRCGGVQAQRRDMNSINFRRGKFPECPSRSTGSIEQQVKKL